MRRLCLVALAFGFLLAACTSDTTATTAPKTATTVSVDAVSVPKTPVVGLLDPYNAGGEGLLHSGTVEAHWYQWGELYVVLYRGFDADDGTAICAGNSVLDPAAGYQHVTNSPHIGAADDICVGAPRIAEAPLGVYTCGSLLYYFTEIPTDSEGTLWGTLEIGDGEWAGHTSETTIDLANTPMFEPGLSAYELPPAGVDSGGIVECG